MARADDRRDTGPEKKPGAKPKNREDAIRQMVERDPERAARLLREILRKQ